MPAILISYRRADSSAIAGRIFDRLAAQYGEESVFMDVDHIPFGIDFRTHIQETLQRTDVLIAVIGGNWLGKSADGAARMHEKTDPVRVEIETALERKTPIIPVLVDGARMPQSADLPEEFGNFALSQRRRGGERPRFPHPHGAPDRRHRSRRGHRRIAARFPFDNRAHAIHGRQRGAETRRQI